VVRMGPVRDNDQLVAIVRPDDSPPDPRAGLGGDLDGNAGGRHEGGVRSIQAADHVLRRTGVRLPAESTAASKDKQGQQGEQQGVHVNLFPLASREVCTVRLRSGAAVRDEKIAPINGYSPFAPTSPLPGAPTSPAPFRNEMPMVFNRSAAGDARAV